MLADHINTLEVKLPKQFMGVIKPKVIKFSTQYPDNVTQEGSLVAVSWPGLGSSLESCAAVATPTQSCHHTLLLLILGAREHCLEETTIPIKLGPYCTMYVQVQRVETKFLVFSPTSLKILFWFWTLQYFLTFKLSV